MMTGDSVAGVAVLGAGTMGSGIAQVASAAGHDVSLQDMTLEQASAGKTRIAKGLEGQVAKGKMPAAEAEGILARITPQESVEDAVRDADLVIEAVPENLELKSDLFRRVCAVTRPRNNTTGPFTPAGPMWMWEATTLSMFATMSL